MNKQEISTLKAQFDTSIHHDNQANIEFCYARELMPILGYDRWENFLKVVDKAKIACTNSNITLADHFRDVTKMVPIGSGAERSSIIKNPHHGESDE